MLFEISNNLGKRSVTHKLLVEEKTTKKKQNISNIDKSKICENKSSRKIHPYEFT